MTDLRAKDRLIVALDVPTPDEAYTLVRELEGVVSFYKVGLELLMGGGMREILTTLIKQHQVFVDLKLPGDISETIRRVVNLAATLGVRFLTLSASADEATVRAAVEGRGASDYPRLLFVSYLSGLDSTDFAQMTGSTESNFEQHLLARSDKAIKAGCDGLIASGTAIRLLRDRHPGAIIVSPAIRMPGEPSDDHKRLSTPEEAMKMGADYLVVGRPIRNAPDRRGAALRFIEEIERTSQRGSGRSLRPVAPSSGMRSQPAV
jgi:orotidine-5'-phosphate decarboxylase